MNDNIIEINDVKYNKKFKKEVNKLIYKPLRTIRECNDWAKESLKISHVDYSGFHIDISNRINRQLQIMFNLYPEIKTIRWIGDIEKSAKEYCMNSRVIKEYFKIKNYNMKDFIYDISEASIIVTINEDCKYKGLWFDKKEMKRPKKVAESCKKGINDKFYAKSTYGIEAFVTHEYAHHIEDFLREKNSFIFMDKIWEKYNKNIKNKKKRSIRLNRIINNLGEYASYDISEFFAEAINEYIHNPKPRTLAKQIGQETEKAFRAFRLQLK